ncbi:stage II sporulation protein M [Chitinimonas koreensis]|uniref:stage II sporulation protein M n=1 Tax=Chitinimonas koreensis TaxID=356302 RepID=UPI00041ED0BB|nr:stage II sporulation protein M [Chitinimonas koreensis]QNM95777.1 stage II sporulation protein M [Chitinimonas koreensis]
MKQAQFEAQHAALWDEVAVLVKGRQGDPRRLPALYRQLCQSLALARQRGYSPLLTEHLHGLVLAAHRRLYGTQPERPLTLRRWLGVELPRRVREEWRLLLLACIAFWGVALAVGFLVWYQPHWAYSWMDWQQLNEYRQMYDPGHDRVGRSGTGDDVKMFGFYIWNNVSICFRTFAGGLFGGVPALVSLVYNGMHGGVVAAWLSRDASTATVFWSFVVTHSSFEITGLILSGVAGMRLGLSLIRPGRFGRRHSLEAASRRMFPVLVGAALLTVLAAFFEGFWSAAGAIPPAAKFTVGGLCWALVIGFFAFAGRRGRHAA